MALVPMLERKLMRMYNACMSIPEGKTIPLHVDILHTLTSSERAALRRGLTAGIQEFKRLFKGMCNGSRCENLIRTVFANYMDILDRILKGKALRRSQSAFLEKQSKAYPPRSRSRYLTIVKLRSKHFEQAMYKNLNATMAALEAFSGHYFAKMTESIEHVANMCHDAVAAEAAKLPPRSRACVISAGMHAIADIARSAKTIRAAGKDYKKHMLTMQNIRKFSGGDNEGTDDKREVAIQKFRRIEINDKNIPTIVYNIKTNNPKYIIPDEDLNNAIKKCPDLQSSTKKGIFGIETTTYTGHKTQAECFKAAFLDKYREKDINSEVVKKLNRMYPDGRLKNREIERALNMYYAEYLVEQGKKMLVLPNNLTTLQEIYLKKPITGKNLQEQIQSLFNALSNGDTLKDDQPAKSFVFSVDKYELNIHTIKGATTSINQRQTVEAHFEKKYNMLKEQYDDKIPAALEVYKELSGLNLGSSKALLGMNIDHAVYLVSQKPKGVTSSENASGDQDTSAPVSPDKNSNVLAGVEKEAEEKTPLPPTATAIVPVSKEIQGETGTNEKEDEEKSGDMAAFLTFGVLGLGIVTQSAPLLFFGLIYAAVGMTKSAGDTMSLTEFKNNMKKLRESRIGNFTLVYMIWKYAEMPHENKDTDAVTQITEWCNQISESSSTVDDMMSKLKYENKDPLDKKEIVANLKSLYKSLFNYKRNEDTGQAENKCTSLLETMREAMIEYVHNMYDVAAGLWVIEQLNSDNSDNVKKVIEQQYEAARKADKELSGGINKIDIHKYSPFTFTTVYNAINHDKEDDRMPNILDKLVEKVGIIRDGKVYNKNNEIVTLDNVELKGEVKTDNVEQDLGAINGVVMRQNSAFDSEYNNTRVGGKRQVKRRKGGVTKPKKLYTT